MDSHVLGHLACLALFALDIGNDRAFCLRGDDVDVHRLGLAEAIEAADGLVVRLPRVGEADEGGVVADAVSSCPCRRWMVC